MAHFAKLNEQNIVTSVVVISNADLLDENGNENEQLGVAICEQIFGIGPWVQTSYNNSFRNRYAGIGDAFDPIKNIFVAQKPYPSWSLDENGNWQPPIPRPATNYMWDENSLMWKEIQIG